jgi:hypothetical protein
MKGMDSRRILCDSCSKEVHSDKLVPLGDKGYCKRCAAEIVATQIGDIMYRHYAEIADDLLECQNGTISGAGLRSIMADRTHDVLPTELLDKWKQLSWTAKMNLLKKAFPDRWYW